MHSYAQASNRVARTQANKNITASLHKAHRQWRTNTTHNKPQRRSQQRNQSLGCHHVHLGSHPCRTQTCWSCRHRCSCSSTSRTCYQIVQDSDRYDTRPQTCMLSTQAQAKIWAGLASNHFTSTLTSSPSEMGATRWQSDGLCLGRASLADSPE